MKILIVFLISINLPAQISTYPPKSSGGGATITGTTRQAVEVSGT